MPSVGPHVIKYLEDLKKKKQQEAEDNRPRLYIEDTYEQTRDTETTETDDNETSITVRSGWDIS